LGTVKTIAAEEGAGALFGGLTAGLQRQMIFAGLRIGLYVPIRDMITGPLEEGQFPSLMQKIATAMISGTLAITVANPTDLVKVKMQAQGAGKLQGIPPKYSGCMDCYG
jgi:solute carrier family 25 (mitochondrial uncoupling protein), member 8/9